MADKHYIKLMIAMFTLISLISIVLAIVLSWPYKVIEIKKLSLLTPQVKAGDFVYWQVDFCKYMNVQAVTERKLMDRKNNVWLTVEQTTQFLPGCSVAVVDMLVPETAPAGFYRIKSQSTYTINLVRKEVVNLEIPEFEVLENEVKQ